MDNQEHVQVHDEPELEKASQEAITAVEAIGAIADAVEHYRHDHTTRGEFWQCLNRTLAGYAVHTEALKIEAETLKQVHAEDPVLNALGAKFGMTLNQVKSFMDMCDSMNKNHLDGTGVTCVPFWFHEQYLEQAKLNESLIQETESLLLTLKKVNEQAPLEKLGIQMPERKSIITGLSAPYVPGVTGPRHGDEHLDKEHINLKIN